MINLDDVVLDWKIAKEVRELNDIGVITYFSCSGHTHPADCAIPVKLCAGGRTNDGRSPYLVMKFSQQLLEVLTNIDTQLDLVDVEVWRLKTEFNGVLTLILRGMPCGAYAAEHFAFALRYLIYKLKKLM